MIDLSVILSDHKCIVKRLVSTLFIGLLVATPLLDISKVLAASASLSLSPASTSAAKGSVVSISIYENSGGDAVNAAKANLTYPANQLDFVNIVSSSAFSIVAANSGGGGSVTIDRGALPAVSGRQLVATVRFKAKVDSGTANVAIAGGSAIAVGSSNILGGTSGSNITFKAPAVATPAAPAPPKDTIAPTIKDVSAKDIDTSAATIAWTTSEPATSEVSFGLDNRYGLVAVDTAPVTDHKIVLNSPLMRPATDYHYLVKSVDPAGNAVSDSDKTFTTKGATLQATIVDQNKKPVVGAKVTIGKVSGVTDKKGQVKLENLKLGDFAGTVTYKGKKMIISGEIKPIDPSGAPQTQTFSVQVSHAPLWLLVVSPIVLLLILAGVLLFLKKRRNQTPKGPNSSFNAFAAGFAARMPHRKSNIPNIPKANIKPKEDTAPKIATPTLIKPTISLESPQKSASSPPNNNSKAAQ